jgi:hypothetical protein
MSRGIRRSLGPDATPPKHGRLRERWSAARGLARALNVIMQKQCVVQ